MDPNLKQKIHQLVDNCNDDFVLEETRVLLESSTTGASFFNELDEEDKDNFLELEDEHEKGHALTHNRLKHQFGEWKKK